MTIKMLFKHSLIALSLSFALLSCTTSPYITTSDMCKNLPNMQYSSTIFSDRVFSFTMDFKNLDDSVTVYIYKKVEKLDKSIGINFAILFNPMAGTKYDYCAAAFKNSYLYYWGYVDDFKKESDPFIQLMGEKISEKLINDYGD